MAYLPLAEISAYGRKDWTVKARVSTRGRMREFKKGNETGYVLSCDLIDSQGGEIRATLWGETAKQHDLVLQAGKVFTFSKGQVKVANKKFSSVKHQYELSFDDRSAIEPAADDANIQQIKYHFTELKKVRDLTTPCSVDLCVVVKEMSEPKNVRTDLWMRKCVVVDQSQHSIELAVWDQEQVAEDLTGKVLTLKAANIKEYNGRSASVNCSNMKVDMDIPAVKAMQEWWTAGGKDGSVASLSQQGLGAPGAVSTNKEGTLEELRDASEALQVDQAIYWTVAQPIYLSHVKTTKKEGGVLNLTYDACPDCKKKCEGTNCPKCSKTVKPEARIIASSVKIEDTSGDQWVSMFDDSARVVLGMTGNEVKTLEDNREKLKTEMHNRCFTERFSARIRAQMVAHEGVPRTKISVVKAEKLNVVAHGNKMLKSLQELYPRSSAAQQSEFKDMLSFLEGSDSEQVKATMTNSWTDDFTRLKGIVA